MPGDLDRRYLELKRLRKVVADLELRLSSRRALESREKDEAGQKEIVGSTKKQEE